MSMVNEPLLNESSGAASALLQLKGGAGSGARRDSKDVVPRGRTFDVLVTA